MKVKVVGKYVNGYKNDFSKCLPQEVRELGYNTCLKTYY